MKTKTLLLTAGISYLVIFFTAVFANFFVLESLKSEPLKMIQNNNLLVRFGILAFMITVVFDVIVAWALNELYQKHSLTKLSTYFRLIHAAIMAVALFALIITLNTDTGNEILKHVNVFNIIWLIGLFFFGIHLILLGIIMNKPKIISFFLIIAGIMYMADTTAQFMFSYYESYSSLFLALVAIPSITGEISFAVWLLVKGIKNSIEIPAS